MKTTTTEVDKRGSARLLVAEPQGTFSASGGQPQTHEWHIAEVVGNCQYWEGARPARKSSRRTNHKGRTIQRVGGGVTNGGGTVRAVGGIEPGSDPWLVANPTTLPRGQSHIHAYLHTNTHTCTHTSPDSQTDRQTNRQAGRQAERQKHRKTGRQTDTHAYV